MITKHDTADKDIPNQGYFIVYLSSKYFSTDCHQFYSHGKLRAGKYKQIKGFSLLIPHLYGSSVNKNMRSKFSVI